MKYTQYGLFFVLAQCLFITQTMAASMPDDVDDRMSQVNSFSVGARGNVDQTPQIQVGVDDLNTVQPPVGFAAEGSASGVQRVGVDDLFVQSPNDVPGFY